MREITRRASVRAPRQRHRGGGIRTLVALVAALLVAGAEGHSDAGPLDDMRGFARATAMTYGKSAVPDVVAAPGREGEGARWDGRRVIVDPRFVDTPHLLALVAHELAHFVLGHEALLEITAEAELEASTFAVEIMARVLGMPEDEALAHVYSHLLAAHHGPPVALPGHRPPCQEIADVLGRFPHHRGWTAGLECASGPSGVTAAAPSPPHAPGRGPILPAAPEPSGDGGPLRRAR